MTGADGLDMVPVGARATARRPRSPADPVTLRDELTALRQEIAAGRSHLASGRLTAEQAADFRASVRKLNNRAKYLAARVKAGGLDSPAKTASATPAALQSGGGITTDAKGRLRGPDGRFISAARAKELRDANGGADPAPVTTPTRETPVRPKPVEPAPAVDPGRPPATTADPTLQPAVLPASSDPTVVPSVRPVRGYAQATESAVEAHARVMEAGRAQTSAGERLNALRGEIVAAEYRATFARVRSEAFAARGVSLDRDDAPAAAAELDRLRNEAAEARRSLDGASAAAREAVLFPDADDVPPAAKGGGALPANVRDGHGFFARLVGPGSPMGAKPVRVKVSGERSRAYSLFGTISVGPDERPSVVAHEMAHQLENRDPAALRAAVAFRKKRQAESNGRIRPLNDIVRDKTGVKGTFAFGEVAAEDKFFDEYCGKVYQLRVGPVPLLPNSGTEILSMGVERLYDDPIGFAREDPEYFQMVLTTLQGDRRKVKA